ASVRRGGRGRTRSDRRAFVCYRLGLCIPGTSDQRIQRRTRKGDTYARKQGPNYTPKERSLGGSLFNGGNDAKFDKQFEVKITGFCTGTQFGNPLFSYCWL